MPAFTTYAIVLRRIHFGETDNILTLYARDRGRVSAIAKGARKAISRNSGATEALTHTRFQLATGRTFAIVTQTEVQESFPALRQDLHRLAHGLYLADLIEHSVEDNEPNPVLFDLLLSGLYLVQYITPPEFAARWFELQLLRDLGYAPDLKSCAVCGASVPGVFPHDEIFALAASLGGALCPNHAHPATHDDHTQLCREALVTMQTLDAVGPDDGNLLSKMATPGTVALDQMRLALRRYLRFRIERELKSAVFMDSLRHMP